MRDVIGCELPQDCAHAAGPASASDESRDRVDRLLEAGENVFLNGAMFGMTRPEIAKKFEEIVALAEEFLGNLRETVFLRHVRPPVRARLVRVHKGVFFSGVASGKTT